MWGGGEECVEDRGLIPWVILQVSYKRVPTNALMGAIQLGIANSIGSLASKPKRDLLLQDFDVIETVSFPPFVLIY